MTSIDDTLIYMLSARDDGKTWHIPTEHATALCGQPLGVNPLRRWVPFRYAPDEFGCDRCQAERKRRLAARGNN
ncbi:MAG TPA: hypothetical protein VHP11_06750 [Tepidisphaeraceae bacterium]|nr:hypothetical protein [Tepidisphaeraceae bacterium]